MWVVRAGQKSIFIPKVIDEKYIFLPWDGYKFPLSELKNNEEIKEAVSKEKGTDNITTVGNWAGQIETFVKRIKKDDYVLIPRFKSREYIFAKVVGDYEFNPTDKDKLYHRRKIDILHETIPSEIFDQSIRYSLGAFRTVFSVRDEEVVLKAIKEWKES